MNNKKVDVSIIVPIYKAENYLIDCLESLLSQTLISIELILINDGSPDKSGAIADDYAIKDKRISVVHKANGGVSSARNAGLDIAKGVYVAFVDADDVIKPEMFESLCKKAEFGKYDIVLSPLLKGVPENYSTKQLPLLPIKQCYLTNTNPGDLLDYYIRCHGYSSPCGNLYKRNIIEEEKLRFLEGVTLGEDDLFNLNFFSYARSLVAIEKPFYFYRTVNGSATNKYRKDRFEMYLRMDMERRKLIEKYNLDLDRIIDGFMAKRYSNTIINEINSVRYRGLKAVFYKITIILRHPAVLRAIRGCSINSLSVTGSQRILIRMMKTRSVILVTVCGLGINLLKRIRSIVKTSR